MLYFVMREIYDILSEDALNYPVMVSGRCFDQR